MSSLSLKPTAFLCPLVLSITALVHVNCYADTPSNDLLRYELWGLESTARTVENSPSNIPAASISETGTCAEKPDIVNNS